MTRSLPVARAAAAPVGSADASPGHVMDSPPVGRRRCSSLRSSPEQAVCRGLVLIQAGRLTFRTEEAKQERSDRPGESSLPAVDGSRPGPTSEAEAATERERGRRRSEAAEDNDQLTRRATPRSEQQRAVGEPEGPPGAFRCSRRKKGIAPRDP